MRKHIALFLTGLAMTGFFLWYAWKNANLHEVVHIFAAHANFTLAIPFLTVYAAFFWIKALRWRLLLGPIHATTVRQLFPMVIIGYAGNVLLPAQLGEAARAYALGWKLRANSSPILASVALERLLDLFALMVFLEAALLLSSEAFPSLRIIRYALAIAIGVGAMLTALYLFRTDMFVMLCRRTTAFLPAPLHAWLINQLRRGAAGLQSLRHAHLLFGVLSLSFAMWGLMSVCVYFALVAVGIHTPISAAIIVLAVTVVGLALPTSPGFVGTIQACFLVALTPYNIAAEQTLAASLFYHLLITVPPLLAACIFLLYLTRRNNTKAKELLHTLFR